MMDVQNQTLEILISTMYRENLDFLERMFQFNDLNALSVLIINQTTPDKLLSSGRDNIRVVNSFDKGLSRSRNLAIEHSMGDIGLIADDDVIFLEDLSQIISASFIRHDFPAFISFKAQNFDDVAYRTYPSQNQEHSLKSLRGIISWEIALNLKLIKKRNVRFDERFGLGSEFTTAEEYLLLRTLIKDGLNGYFENRFIVKHPNFNSGMESASDRVIFARSALNYKLYGPWAYVWLAKYLFWLYRKQLLTTSLLFQKYKIGLRGISAYFKKQ